MADSEKQKAENEKIRSELRHAYRRMAKTDDGKIVMADLERFCGFWNTSVSEQSPNALQTMFAEGKRRVFLRISGMIKVKENE